MAVNYKPVPLWGYTINLREMNTASAISMFGTMTTDIGTILASVIPTVLGIVAVLIGLGFAVRLVRKYVGRKI